MTRERRHTCGFSLLEMMIVLAIIAITTTIAVLGLGDTLRNMHADTGLQTAMQVLRSARQSAIDQRSRIWVSFNTPAIGPHTMSVSRIGSGQPPIQIPLPSDVQFFADPALPIPPNTPDGIGNGKVAIDFQNGFGAPPGVDVYFMPDGSAQDVTGNTVNGVVYIERVGYLRGARAISLFGATGRLRSWHLASTGPGGFSWQ